MKTIIDLFEQQIPADLRHAIPTYATEEEKVHYENMREYLYKDAAENWFNLMIRPIIRQHLNMFLEEGAPSHWDWALPVDVFNKYTSILKDDDELKLMNIEAIKVLDDLKDMGLF